MVRVYIRLSVMKCTVSHHCTSLIVDLVDKGTSGTDGRLHVKYPGVPV